jgi:hypothetical protein
MHLLDWAEGPSKVTMLTEHIQYSIIQSPLLPTIYKTLTKENLTQLNQVTSAVQCSQPSCICYVSGEPFVYSFAIPELYLPFSKRYKSSAKLVKFQVGYNPTDEKKSSTVHKHVYHITHECQHQ